jgi:hypothetical protein
MSYLNSESNTYATFESTPKDQRKQRILMISFSFLMDNRKIKGTPAFHAYHALTTYEAVIFNLSLLKDFTLM